MSHFDEAFAAVSAHIGTGRIPGAVLGLVTRDGTREFRAIGNAQTVPDVRPMTTGTWFDLASVSKVIFTTSRILQLAVEGMIDLDAPITSIIPDFRQYDPNCWERQVTFRQCLGHATAFPAVEPIYTYGNEPERLRAFVLQREWRKLDTPVYSDINYILLGIALERIARKPIRAMDAGAGFAFFADPAHAAATEYCSLRQRVLVGEVHDENCWALEGSGHAGLFGTVESVLGFAADLLARQDDADVRLMRTVVAGHRTHGWENPYDGWSGGSKCSADTIGHTGFTGTGLWVDFERGHAWTLLTNRVHPTRHFDSGIFTLRQQVGDIING
ncbi:Esterase [Ketogulonicigenium robustum]|uniref:Esterase n=1 Tax=Ketogulonicigenium robustum TaxID=92947 RepID=A0A1W6NXB4_9RHOB|nr:serine hydrolase domain-containing protein [Ketogulonicigenium robustum]ARO13886.1 Esterase [Ketogulonicigenium robustum]